MARKDEPYKNLKMKGEQGDYSDLIDPLDYIILENLPNEGDMAFGLYPQGETAKNLSVTHLKPLSVTEVSQRLRMMNALGLLNRVTRINSRQSGKEAWQRSGAGRKVYEGWKAKQPKEGKK